MLRALIFLLPSLAHASDSPGPGFGAYVQAMLALAFIVILLLGAAWLARKITGGKGFGQGGVKIIGGVALGPRERVVLIEAGDTWLVIGIVPGQIRTLHRMPRGTSGTTGEDAPPVAPAAFADWLKTITERRREDS
ncbi:flagellar biosynthetic protein FliO [Dechloromonas sp. ZY10]|uniref:flagellar biosynthetic protein FliO n=1 Tax=Dechloromonas aquae TaxID=2664436 RepID=UPI0035270436